MTPCHPHLLVVSALLGLAAAAQVAAAPITVNSARLNTQAFDSAGVDSDLDTSTAYGTRTVSSASGGSSSTTYVGWQDTGSGALFDYDFDQARTGTASAFAFAEDRFLLFTVQRDTTYLLSGLYSMTGSANRTVVDVQLRDVTGVMNHVVLFHDISESRNTANESFSLGAVGDGDQGNFIQGSLTGTLLAGHQYSFTFTNFIQAFPRTDGGATATGCLTLSIGGATGGGDCGVATVPEPGSLALAGLALAGLGLARRRARPA